MSFVFEIPLTAFRAHSLCRLCKVMISKGSQEANLQTFKRVFSFFFFLFLNNGFKFVDWFFTSHFPSSPICYCGANAGKQFAMLSVFPEVMMQVWMRSLSNPALRSHPRSAAELHSVHHSPLLGSQNVLDSALFLFQPQGTSCLAPQSPVSRTSPCKWQILDPRKPNRESHGSGTCREFASLELGSAHLSFLLC